MKHEVIVRVLQVCAPGVPFANIEASPFLRHIEETMKSYEQQMEDIGEGGSVCSQVMRIEEGQTDKVYIGSSDFGQMMTAQADKIEYPRDQQVPISSKCDALKGMKKEIVPRNLDKYAVVRDDGEDTYHMVCAVCCKVPGGPYHKKESAKGYHFCFKLTGDEYSGGCAGISE
jgi:hypothetical protein